MPSMNGDPFRLIVCIFLIYWLLMAYIRSYTSISLNPEFRGLWLDKIVLLVLAGFGYSKGVHPLWITGFVLVFMGLLLWAENTRLFRSRRGGAAIAVVHEYDRDPEKRSAQMGRAVIPLHIYQTWHTKKLPSKMDACVQRLKADNPEFQHHLFDDADCRKYIETYYDSSVLNAYDSLNAGAYKADLWRYCVLYRDGGIYMDIKLECEPNFKLLELVDREHFVLDRPYIGSISLTDELAWIQSPDYASSVYARVDTNLWSNGNIGLYNAFMVCKAGNPILKECIDAIVENVRKRNYGYNQLYPTGPGLLGSIYFRGNREKIHDIQLYNSLNGDCILGRKKKILHHYPEYRHEQSKSGTKHYNTLWETKQIYANRPNRPHSRQ